MIRKVDLENNFMQYLSQVKPTKTLIKKALQITRDLEQKELKTPPSRQNIP